MGSRACGGRLECLRRSAKNREDRQAADVANESACSRKPEENLLLNSKPSDTVHKGSCQPSGQQKLAITDMFPCEPLQSLVWPLGFAKLFR